MDRRDTDTAVASLRSLCEDSDIEFVVAFGSRLTGESTPDSDLDVAVKFAETVSASDRFDKQCFLSGNLQQDDAPFVDVSDIERLPPAVAHEALSGSLVCGDEHAFEQFQSTLEAELSEGDIDPRRADQELIDRIALEGLRG